MSQPTDTGPSIEATDLTLRYGDVTALDGLSFRLEGGKIHGLLGRNGSGKTSLLSVVASFRKATAGGIRVDGQPVFEDPAVTRQVCLIRGSGDSWTGGTPQLQHVAALVVTTLVSAGAAVKLFRWD